MPDLDPKASLESDEEATRLEAVMALARAPDEEGLRLLSECAARDPSALVRYHARKAVEAHASRLSARRQAASAPVEPGVSGYHAVFEKVEAILAQGVAEKRWKLAEALGRTRDRRYLTLLDRLAISDADRGARRAAAQARDRIEEETAPELRGGEEPVSALEGWLRQDDPSVRAAAILRGYRDWKEPLALLAHRLALAEPDPWVTLVWLRALPGLGDAGLAALAPELLRRRDPHVRARAARAWLALAPAEAMPFVAGLLDDAEELVRETALRALEEHDAAYAVGLLEGRVSPARLAPALRSIAWLAEFDTPEARRALLRLFARESDGRLRERLEAAVAEKLPAAELPLLLELANAGRAHRDEALVAARAVQVRLGISAELFAELLREYG
ncbi:MAG: hypothetical protein HYY25_05500, partial [Candidatus Wallbacteria bacterium]|nr:hypothetical protein [Candidatus Wallbacteria bacterium]